MLIDFKNVQVQRGSRTVLATFSVSLGEQRIGIIGLNGSGKSSLIRLINGLLLPAHGQVLVDGLDTSRDATEIRRRVGFVFQNPDNQIVFPVVHEDIAFGLKHRVTDPAVKAQKVVKSLEYLGIGHLHDRFIQELSGGEKQLVALAAVMATDPSLLIFDEPTTQLDIRARNHFEHVLTELPQQAIVVSHDLDLIQSMQRVLVLHEGRLAFDGMAKEAIAWFREHCA